MKILVAPNALKGSLDAFATARAIADGLARAGTGAVIDQLPVADGGDGTAKVLVAARGGWMIDADVEGPRGAKVRACMGWLGDVEGASTAVIEVALAVGLALLSPGERDPLVASSYGAGQLVVAALDRGARRIFVGLGGSATVDGAAGLVEALGARLLDRNGRAIARGGAGLGDLDRIDIAALDPRLESAELVALCDVDNPLLGETGAARVFGPQKGATPAAVERLEANLERLAAIISRDLGRDVRTLVHGGAAGGMGAGIAGILGATLAPGADRVLDLLRFEERLAGCHLVVTAEGLLDRQTLGRKAPLAVASRARRRGVPVVALAGGIAGDVAPRDFAAFDAILTTAAGPISIEEAMAKAADRMTDAAEQLGRLLALGAAAMRAPR
jgi:glycerate kinase